MSFFVTRASLLLLLALTISLLSSAAAANRCRVAVDAEALTSRLQRALSSEVPPPRGQHQRCLLLLRLRRRSPDQLQLVLSRDNERIIARDIPTTDGLEPALRSVVLLVTTYLEKPPAASTSPSAQEAPSLAATTERERARFRLSAGVTLLWWNEPADTQPGIEVAAHLSLSRRWLVGLRVGVTGFVPPEPTGIDLDLTEVALAADLQLQLLHRSRLTASLLAGAGVNIGRLEVRPTVYAGPPKPQSFNDVQALLIVGASVSVRLWPRWLRLVLSGGVQLRLSGQQIKLRPQYPSAGLIEPGHLLPWTSAVIEVGL